jgi:pentatricopeptide repeat protein
LLKTVDSAISDGSVKGEELEFEGFMFDQGVSAPLPVLPSVEDPAALANSLPRDAGPIFDPSLYSNPAEVVESFDYGDIDADAFGAPAGDTMKPAAAQGPLPFWLQDQPQRSAPASEGPSQSPLNPTPIPSSGSGAVYPLSADQALGDLPPIIPFDFSTLGGDLDDEPFGFNTEELNGLVLGERDPMVVTANLEALADLMGGHAGIVPDTKPSRPAGLGDVDMAAPPVSTYPRPQIAPSPPPARADVEYPTSAEADLSTEDPTTRFTPESSDSADQGGESDSGGWMATVTGDLAPDPVAALAGSLDGMPNSDIAIEDLDVAPFDYSQLDLDDENESPTSYLQAGGPKQGPPTSKLETATASHAILEQASGPDGRGGSEAKTPGTADAAPDEVWSEADGDTSLFMPVLAGEAVAAEDAEMPTSYLREQAAPEAPIAESTTDDRMRNMNGHESTPHSTEPEQTLFKARVARGPWGNQVPAPPEPQPLPEPGPVTQQAQAEVGTPLRKAKATAVLPSLEEASHGPRVQSAAPTMTAPATRGPGPQVSFDQGSPKMPAPGDIMASGPLPVLHGFEDLTAWIERYPNDMGAHLALASAYTQAGDVDTGLRVYRRMLRKPYVSENILAMIQDELHDLEDQAHHYPRYYQVRGDLLVRQGHRREAIDEYNKLS